MVKINHYDDVWSELWYNQDDNYQVYLGDISCIEEMYDICVQIKEEQSDKYYFKFKGEDIFVNKQGRRMKHVEGFYDASDKLLDKLLGL